VPYIEALSQAIKPSLQGMDELPRDFTKMFDLNLFRFDTDLIPQTLKLYDLLGVPHDPLTLIPPQFECPLPKLQPATFPPAMREPDGPALDQFDLDEHFAKEGLRLAQLTNKCTNGDEDLEYYISESGEILGVMPSLPFGERSAKHILFHIFKEIVQYKKQNLGGSSAIEGIPAVQALPYPDEGFGLGGGGGGGGGGGSRHVDLAPIRSAAATTQLPPVRHFPAL
jgi:intraflagellar transport protein 52